MWLCDSRPLLDRVGLLSAQIFLRCFLNHSFRVYFRYTPLIIHTELLLSRISRLIDPHVLQLLSGRPLTLPIHIPFLEERVWLLLRWLLNLAIPIPPGGSSLLFLKLLIIHNFHLMILIHLLQRMSLLVHLHHLGIIVNSSVWHYMRKWPGSCVMLL
jgi:hypothetical protein